MPNVVEVDFSDDRLIRRYDRLFDECPDAYIQQSTDWCEVIRGLGPDQPIFLICEDGEQDLGALPLYLYQHELGNILTSVPQAGPLGGVFHRRDLSPEMRAAVYRKLLENAVKIAERHQCFTLSVITNPFADDLDQYERYLSPDFIFENFTQYVPLTQPAHRNHGHRNNVNRSKGAGFTISHCKSVEELTEWYELHRKRHVEIRAEPLAEPLFRNLFDRLVSKGKAQLILIKLDGKIVSGGFYVYHRRVVDVFMLSFDSAYAKSAPNFLNTDYSMEWAKGLGLEIYNWQSSASKNCGVYHFKRQWGSLDRPYYFVTKLIGNCDRIRAIGLDALRRNYQWHYVVPYGVFQNGFDQKYFSKC